MRISFDLDGTLIPDMSPSFPLEKRSGLGKLLGFEPMRKGAPALIKKLRYEGHEVGIYTTSFRTILTIKLWLAAYGIKADFIINEKRNIERMAKSQINASKYPPAFNIDLHIDDLPGVRLEGQRLGFRTLIIPKETSSFETLVVTTVAGSPVYSSNRREP